MKKYIVPIAFMIYLVCGMAGCINEDIPGNKQDNEIKVDKNSIVLMLQNSKNLDAKDALPNNEDYLEDISIFFFDPTMQKLEFSKTNLKVEENKLVTISLDAKMNGKNFDIYVIANYDVTTDEIEGSDIKKDKLELVVGETKLEQLKGLLLTTIFNRNLNGIESSFVMDGMVKDVEVNLGEPISKTITLERAAARVQLFASFEKFEETIDGVVHTYTPRIQEIPVTVTMYNGIGRTKFSSYEPKTADIVNPRVRTLNESKEDDLDGVTREYYYNTVPLYSYANDWSGEAGTSMATYLELKVEWLHTTTTGINESKPYYYQVPISNNQKLERNKAYQIHVDISMMGSEVPTETVVLEGKVEVISWTDIEFDSELNRYKYLAVSPQADTLRNVASAQFKYSSSSPITVKVEEVSFINYQTAANDKVILNEANPTVQIGTGSSLYTVELSDFHAYIVGNEIYFEHKINKENQFYPYVIRLKVSNNDEGVDDEYINIIQYPAIYVVAENNASNSNVFVYNNSGHSEVKGTVNGKDISFGKTVDIDASGYDGDKNPNQYTIYVSAFDKDDVWDAVAYKTGNVYNDADGHDYKPYMIGDPREDDYKVSNVDVVKELKKYRATKSDEVSQGIVAPIFKVASSRGGLGSSIGFATAKHRCSAYQENGYPAGRWRLPTEAEIQYIRNLSSKNKIPALFLDDDAYIAASGRGWKWKRNNYGWGDMESYGYGFVRCVYDVWYWGDEKIPSSNTFKWGDDPNGSLRGFNE